MAGSHIIALVCIASALWWTWALYAAVRSIRGIPALCADRSPAPARWPRLSLIITARDEERDLERAVRTRLDDDYPDLQVVIVDDRSSDRTPEIADRLAQKDPRVKVVHVTDLEAGWLGKVHAMQQGVALADGPWLLFSDADIEFAPGTLRRAIARCEHEGRDHMTVVPEFREHGLLVNAAVDCYCHLLLVAGRPWQVSNPHSRAALGAGLFNLVRRSVYERTPGLPWLRMEIADDIALGQMLKRHGARPLLMKGVGAVALDFYHDLGEMAGCLEKSGFSVIGRHSALRLLLACTLGLALEVGFLWGLLHPASWVQALSVATLFVAWGSQVLMARWMGRSVGPALLFPLGMVLMAWMSLRSGVLVWRRGGVAWRGTVYSVRDLRAGSRLTIP